MIDGSERCRSLVRRMLTPYQKKQQQYSYQPITVIGISSFHIAKIKKRMDIRILSSTMYHYTISTIHIVRLVFPYYKKTALAYHR